VDLLAQKIVAGEVPDLKDKKILSVNLGELVAGTSHRGVFEERVTALIKEAQDPNVLLFINDFHDVSGTGKSEGSSDMMSLLKDALSRGTLKMMGATTPDQYRKTFEKNPAFSKNFESLVIQEPDKKKMLFILRSIEQGLEKEYELTITDRALEATVNLADRYIKESRFPDKANMILHAACVRVLSNAKVLPLEISKLDMEAQALEQQHRSLTEDIGISLPSSSNQRIETELASLPARIAELKRQYQEQKEVREQSEKRLIVDEEDIVQIISERTGIPLQKL